MRAKFKYFLLCGSVAAVMASLVIGLASCSSAPAAGLSPSPVAANSATGSSPSQAVVSSSAQPATPSIVPAQRPGGGANGTITQINGHLITLNTPQGSVTVQASSNTVIQKTAAGAMSDLQTGQFLTVTGKPDTSGNIAASTIAIRPQDLNPPRFNQSSGTPTNIGGRPDRSVSGNGTRPIGGQGNGQFGVPGNGQFGGQGNGVFGTLSQINGTTLILTAGQGLQVSVTTGADTQIQKIVNGAIADLEVGESVAAIGIRDASGNLNAASIQIR